MNERAANQWKSAMCAVAEKVHLFEQAGLGKAPFRCIGMESSEVRAMRIKDADTTGCLVVDAATCFTTCDYCATAIKNAYVIQSADGQRFKVGCDCIRKTGDAGLRRAISDEERVKREAKAEIRRQKEIERRKAACEAFRGGLCEALKDRPHPKGREGETAYDYAQWFLDNPRYMSETFVRLVESVTLPGCQKP